MACYLRRRTALLVVLAGTAAISLEILLAPQIWDAVDATGRDVGGSGGGGARQLSVTEEMEMEDQFHRILLPSVEEIFRKEDDEILAIPGEELPISRESAEASEPQPESSATTMTPHAHLIDANQPLPPYTMEDAIESSKMFDHTFGLLVYDPEDDTFYGMYSKRQSWVSGCQKLINSIKILAYLLRKIFPERFQGKKSEELIIPISSGDYPGVRDVCINHFRQGQESPDPLIPPGWQKIIASGWFCSHNTAPILHFGSVFRYPDMFPNIIAMPMPEPHHLPCFETWAAHKVVCRELRAKGDGEQAKLEFGKGHKWEDLIPQVVWRGTDFSFLTKVDPSLDKPKFRESLINWPWSQTNEDQKTKNIGGQTAFGAARNKRKLDEFRKRASNRADLRKQMLAKFTKAAAVESLKKQYTLLLPRWKAVLLTAEAEVNAQPDSLPWADMKFSTYVHYGQRKSTRGAKDYKDWEDIGFATGGYMSRQTLAQYKYQIDLGGGGGTTWTGTIEKLAMPGLLFHHLTPTKDYIHDWMKPWVHYVPIRADLLDLKEKFDWAESHPVKSKKIADEGTKLMRYLTSPEGFEKMYQEDIVEPLRRVIKAYQPVSTIDLPTWSEAIGNIKGDIFFPVIKCSGSSSKNCSRISIKKSKVSNGMHFMLTGKA